jgi:hypothetical protein
LSQHFNVARCRHLGAETLHQKKKSIWRDPDSPHQQFRHERAQWLNRSQKEPNEFRGTVTELLRHRLNPSL